MSDDYLAYQTYDSLQAFFSTITSLLANRALLEGLGVGDSNSSATFAMLLTILKDATSRIATIVFAHRFGLRIEPDAKRYRFLADLFNDTAFFLELYSPYFGPWGKALALGSGEALRAMCGVAAGASKAALSMHFARHDNLAELNAKEASQETAVGLIGLLVGTLVVNFVEDPRSVICLMTVLVFAHLWVNYLGVCSVHMTTLNRQRATILFREYLETGKILLPNEVAKRENIFFWSPVVSNKWGKKIASIELAESFQHAISDHPPGTDVFPIDGSMYTIFIGTPPNNGLTTIRILLWYRAEADCAITAWYRAMEIAWLLKGEGSIDFHSARSTNDAPFGGSHHDLQQSGWNVYSQALETGRPVRIRFQPAARKDE